MAKKASLLTGQMDDSSTINFNMVSLLENNVYTNSGKVSITDLH